MMAYVNNGGVRIHYEVEGSGPPLLLHHGFTNTLEDWYNQGYVDALQSDHRLILFDARGHGLSDKPRDSASYHLCTMVSDVVAVLDAMLIKQASVFGYSMGGRVALASAKYAPERLSSLIVGGAAHTATRQDSFSNVSGNNLDEFVGALENTVGEKLRRVVYDSIAKSDVAAYTALIQAPSEPIIDVVDTISCPALFFAGTKDAIHPQVVHCASRVPTASLVELHGLNHAEAFVRSDIVIPHVKTFLERFKTHRVDRT